MWRLRIGRCLTRRRVGLPASDNTGFRQVHVWILFNIRSELV